MKGVIHRSLTLAGLFGVIISTSLAQAPRTISFQGRLTNAAGAALADGPRTVTFGLYNGREGALQVTDESQTFSGDTVTLAHAPVVANSGTMAKADGTATYARGSAYTIDNSTGVITRVSSATIPDGAHVYVSFRWTAATIWEGAKSVTVRSGVFSTALGDTAPLPYGEALNQPRYLSARVGTDAEMTPRTALASAPTALSLALPYTASASSNGTVLSVTSTGGGNAICAQQSSSSGSDTAAGRGDFPAIGVMGFGGSTAGLTGRSNDGLGIVGTSINAAGVAGFTFASGPGHHAATVDGIRDPGQGVGTFAGNEEPFGVAVCYMHIPRKLGMTWAPTNTQHPRPAPNAQSLTTNA